MLKAMHAQKDLESAREKAELVIEKLKGMKLPEAAGRIENGIEETLTYMNFPWNIGPKFGPTMDWSGSCSKSGTGPHPQMCAKY